MELVEEFLRVEERFQRLSEATEQEVIDSMRQVGSVRSHCMTPGRCMGCHLQGLLCSRWAIWVTSLGTR